MKLTPAELETLRKHLKTLSIRYEESFNEFLDYLSSVGSLPIHLTNAGLNTRMFWLESLPSSIHTSVTACFCFLACLYMLTFLELFHEKFSDDLPLFRRAA